MVPAIYFLIVIIGVCRAEKNITYDDVKIFKIGDVFKVINEQSDPNCTIITNKNEVINFVKGGNGTDVPSHISLNKIHCGAVINVSANDTGEWIFKNSEHGDKRYFVSVTNDIVTVNVDSQTTISAIENDYILPRLPDRKNITSCYVMHAKMENVPSYKLYNLFDEQENIGFLHSCGARIKSILENAGYWKLFAIQGDNLTTVTSFELAVKKLKDISMLIDKVAQRGSENFTLYRSTSKMCSLIDPHGKNIELTHNELCEYTIPIVTSYHRGVWTYVHYVDYLQRPIETKINLIVNDVEKGKVNVTYHKDRISVIYNATGHHIIKTCKFVSPTGETINVISGVADDKYEYFGNGFGLTSEFQECGITINEPSKLDYGMWKCFINTEDLQSLNSLINIGKELDKVELSEDNPNVIYAQEGKLFKIRCAVNRRLSYCYLRSPNGTIYNVAPYDNYEQNVLSYDGSGLSMGVCGANVPIASKLHDRGVWSCNMGIVDGPNVNTNVSVIVTDSTIAAKTDKINILPTDKSLELVTLSVPGFTFASDYCRWISNTGADIVQDYDDRYEVRSNLTSCTLTIRGVDLYDSVGNWTCQLSNAFEKLQTVIEISFEPDNYVWISTTSALLLLIIVGVTIFFTYNWIRNRSFDDTEQLVRTVDPVEILEPMRITKTQV